MKNKYQIDICVIGAGFLGEYHIQQLKNNNNANLVGFYDTDLIRSKYIKQKYNIDCKSIDELFSQSKAVCIVTPTTTHYDIANKALLNNCHVFIEKPITDTILESNNLIEYAKKNNLIIQVGHIERFNPAYRELNNYNFEPQFIECHRLSTFNDRCLDVSVILDLMIHDIDLICDIKKDEISNIQATGVPVISNSIDIANARITFNDNSVANLTASRISQKSMRKLRIFSKGSYLNLDLLNKNLDIYSIDNNGVIKQCNKEHKMEKSRNALYDELDNFIDSIYYKKQPMINGESGRKALEIALEIQGLIFG